MKTDARYPIAVSLVVWLFAANVANAKVATVPLQNLVRGSTLIVVARVVSVDAPSKELFGERFAYATVVETWKGTSSERIKFLASPTWMCDIADATESEMVVLFLEQQDSERHYRIMHAGRGRMQIRRVDGKDLATIWPDVILPEGTRTEEGPEPKYDFIRSIEVSTLKALSARAPR